MSNNTTTSPINISPQSITGKCDLKCAYNFDYPITNLVATNTGLLINIKCDNQNSTPVTFNNSKYNVEEFILCAPSLHLFNGKQTPSELIIIHTPQSGGPNLSVCIPIVQSGNTNDATNLITEIIQQVSPNSVGETITLNIANFTLNNIVPKQPFYNYNDNNLGNCVVYGIVFAIPLSQTILSTLTTIIPTPYNVSSIGDGNLFFNSAGPNQSSSGGDGIYISCQPVGSSQETTDTTSNTNTNTNTNTSSNSFDYKKYEYLLWIFLLIAFILLLILGINFIISKNTGSPKGLTNSKLNPDSGKSFFSGLKDKFK